MQSQKINILLVDDKPENLLALESLLDEFEVNIVKAYSGAEALKLSMRQDFALILLDVQMPEMDGFETASMLRSVEKTKYIPIIFVTAINKQPDHVFRGYETGAVDYFFKPIEPYILKSKVRVFIELYRQRQQLNNQARALSMANERLRVSNKQMKKFVGIVAHDLRAPLGKLINISEMLLAGVEADALPTFYQLLVQTSHRGFDLVNDILDLTAMESGHVQLECKKFELSDLFEQVLNEVGYLAQEKEIDLVPRVAAPLLVKGDTRRIFQVLTNLIGNAVKFTPRNGKVTLRASTVGKSALVEIIDTGVGMADDIQKTLFDKHEKISTPGTEGERGTGLGLSLSQELINAHDSRIEVNSEPGKGSRFYFKLPLWIEEP